MTAKAATEPQRPPTGGVWAQLPREGRLLLSVVVVQFLGSGLVLPFWVVYLHSVRGFDLDTVGVLMAVLPAAGLAVLGPGGSLIDRAGPRRAMIVCLLLACTGQVVVAFATALPAVAAGLVLVGASLGMSWPASHSMVASVVPPHLRQRYFGLNFALLNLGTGLGGIIGGFIAAVENPNTFRFIYLGDALSYLPALVLLLGPLRRAGGPALHPSTAARQLPQVGYLTVVRQPAVAALTALSFAAGFAGYAQLTVGFPAYALDVSEVSPRALGVAFAANTIAIVCLQMFVLRRIEGRRRTRVVVAMAAAWSVSWLLLAATSTAPGTAIATVLLVGCTTTFAVGETLMQPTLPAMVNDMAPDHLRGRYNAVTSTGLQAASVTAPLVAGWLLDHDHGSTWIAGLLIGLLMVAWISVRWLEPHLTVAANGQHNRAGVSQDDARAAVSVSPLA